MIPCPSIGQWEPLRSIAVKLAHRNKRGCDDETKDPAWRGRLINPLRTCQPGVGAARHYQSGLVRAVLSERQLPELRARKPLHELWLAASGGTSSPRGPSSSPPPLALTPAGRAYPDSLGVNQEKPRRADRSVQLRDWAMLPALAADWSSPALASCRAGVQSPLQRCSLG